MRGTGALVFFFVTAMAVVGCGGSDSDPTGGGPTGQIDKAYVESVILAMARPAMVSAIAGLTPATVEPGECEPLVGVCMGGSGQVCADAVTGVYEFQFDGCVMDGMAYNGTISRSQDGANMSLNMDLSVDDANVTGSVLVEIISLVCARVSFDSVNVTVPAIWSSLEGMLEACASEEWPTGEVVLKTNDGEVGGFTWYLTFDGTQAASLRIKNWDATELLAECTIDMDQESASCTFY